MLPGFRKFGVSRLIAATSRMRISSGPMLEEPQAERHGGDRSRRPVGFDGGGGKLRLLAHRVRHVRSLRSCSL